MSTRGRRRALARAMAVTTVAGTAAGLVAAVPAQAAPPSAVVDKGIRHVIVIDLENESFAETFGPNSPATYLNHTLVPQGELLASYYAVGHVSADNYLAQVSGQAPNAASGSDCISATGGGAFNDLTPGTLDPDQVRFPGQVDGQGCVMPAAVRTIGDQLSAAHPQLAPQRVWREYAEDMGNDPARDGGTPDPLGGTDCAHPTQTDGVGVDRTENAEGPNGDPRRQQVNSPTVDQYANRHNPFVFFHSVIDDAASCAAHVVPLGTVTVGTGGQPDTYQGHLAEDLASDASTPLFSFITPNLCNDAHDAVCAGPNTEGGTTGGLVGADLWLEHWMPLIMNSPAYRNGSTLVVLTFDEGALTDVRAGDNEQAGPNSDNPGYSPVLNVPIAAFGGRTYYQLLGVTTVTPGVRPAPGTMPGGGQVGALLLNPRWVNAGTVVDGVSYNHYSALRTYEDLLGITSGGADGRGHLGFAATATSFGPDVFRRNPGHA